MTKGNISIAPTLVIGLGGTGSKIINNVASLINDANPDLNHKVKYVAFDTDVNELKGIRKKNPNVYTVQTSTSSTVGEYLEVEDYARENWFPVNKIVSRKTLTEGAGQVRAISRLAFNTSLRSGKLSELYKAIDYLFQLEANQQAQTLKIVVVSSLAGGTGSGLILPVGLHLREYLKEKYSRTANIIRGFFILPDVFYSVIPGKEEQSNLNCNAYAAVKELDAFLMRGDGTLDTAKYRDIKFEFPEANSDQVEDIKVMPYDFCTLFDSANTSGKTLSSFSELLNHAATCIYSQIALMSEKINSAEDNTIRALASSKGRARYVGVGASRLVYPYTHIRDYVAYNWAKECISKEWLQYDKDFKKQQVNNQKARNEGHLVKDLHLENVYTDLIEAQIKQKNPFALSISNQCSKLDKDGVTKLEDKWETYIANLEKFSREDTISDELKKSQENTGGKIRDASGSNDGNDWAPVANGCKEYYNLANRSIEQKASSKAYSLFRYDQDENAAAKRDEMFLESYLKDQDNKFIHPNAVRLFLYKLNSSLGEEIVKVENQVKDQEESASFKNLEKEVMKQFSEDAEDDSLSFLSLSEIGAKNNIWSKIFNKVDFSEAKKKFENYFDRVNELLQLKIYFELLKGARG
ncbi:MAG: tubulin-like doman-containing protein [Candidatus Ancillula sp.]|jgi:hypothetical protein|nr:tubulin-like doman-containing protein [Candidatus Ancillula sp.]